MEKQAGNMNWIRRQAIAVSGAVAFVALAAVAFEGRGWADEYHYNNVFMGPRVSGLAGTMIGLADDPSTAWYNPAGLYRRMSTTVTVSATALLARQVSVHGLYGTDMNYKSTAAFTPSGITTTRLGKGNLAFMVLEPDSSSLRLDESQLNVDVISDGRILNTYDGSSYVVGLSYGASIGRSLSLGIGVGYVYQSISSYSLLHIEYKLPREGVRRAVQYESTTSSVSHGLLMLAGLLWSPLGEGGPLTVGLSFRTGANISVNSSHWEQSWNGKETPPKGDMVFQWESAPTSNQEGASRTPPMVGAGIAWHITPWWLIAADITLHGYVKYYSFGEAIRKLATLNASAATEFSLGDGLFLRAGAYTNRSSAPKDLDNAIVAWNEYGGTIGGTFQRGNYDFTFAFQFSWLTGRTSDDTNIGGEGESDGNSEYRISGRNLGIVFGGRYSF